MPGLFRQTCAVLAKDLLVEWQGRGRVLATVSFAVTVLLLFSFAAGPDAGTLGLQTAGYLWLAILMASVLALSESFRTELEDNALSTLVLLPVDPRALFLGKALANALLLTALAATLLPFALVLFHASIAGSWLPLFALFALGALGLSAPGTLYAAMTAQARGRDVMLPLLLFPLVVPVLVAAVKGTSLVLGGDPMGQLRSWVALLAVFDLVYWTLCPLLFGRILEQ